MSQATPMNPQVISGLGLEAKPAGATTVGLPQLSLDPRTYQRALNCVHCGLCLPACPTYTQNGLEADSPRGRIYLMKGVADGKIEMTASVLNHLDLCLDCRACETACPSGVVYHELIEETRTRVAASRKPTILDRVVQAVFFHVFTYPMRLKLALLPVRILQKLGIWERLVNSRLARRLPPQLDKMQQMLPPTGPMWERKLKACYPPTAIGMPALPESAEAGSPLPPPGTPGNPGNARSNAGTVALFPGCVASVLFQHVNRQTATLLQHAGCNVVVPRAFGCCGAIHHHAGREEKAKQFARANIDAIFPKDAAKPKVDCIVNNIAGCGAMLKDYAHLLRDEADYAERAKVFVQRVRDISEVLVELRPSPPQHSKNQTVTYHDACHLAHAQKVTSPPREVLSWIPGLKVAPLPESEMCCGAAGTYNLSQPEMARQLAERKIRQIRKTGADVCVTGNVGCAMQIQSEAQRLGMEIRVVHPVTLLYEAYFGVESGESE